MLMEAQAVIKSCTSLIVLQSVQSNTEWSNESFSKVKDNMQVTKNAHMHSYCYQEDAVL